MSVQHEAVCGFGILLNKEEIVEAVAKCGLEVDHDESEYALSAHYGLPDPEISGNFFSGHLLYLFAIERTEDPETGIATPNAKQFEGLKRMIEECGIKEQPDLCKDVRIS